MGVRGAVKPSPGPTCRQALVVVALLAVACAWAYYPVAAPQAWVSHVAAGVPHGDSGSGSDSNACATASTGDGDPPNSGDGAGTDCVGDVCGDNRGGGDACGPEDASDGAWQFLSTWDDDGNFIECDLVRSGFTWANVQAMFMATLISVWEPASWALRTAVVSAWGMSGLALRRVTLAAHVCSCVALWAVTHLLLTRYTRQEARARVQDALARGAAGPVDAAAGGAAASDAGVAPCDTAGKRRPIDQTATSGGGTRDSAACGVDGVPTGAARVASGASPLHSDSGGGRAAQAGGSGDAGSGGGAGVGAGAGASTGAGDSTGAGTGGGGGTADSAGSSVGAAGCDAPESSGTCQCCTDAWPRHVATAQRHRVTVASVCACLVYALHPLHVEVVGWPSAGSYAPAALCMHAALWLVLRTAPGTGVAGSDVSWPALLLYVLAVMCKSVALLLPAAVVAIDWVPQAQRLHAAVRAARRAAKRAGSAAAGTGTGTGTGAGIASRQEQLAEPGVWDFACACATSVRRRWPLYIALVCLLVPIVGANQQSARDRTVVDTVQLTASERFAKAMVTPWYFAAKAAAPVHLRPHVAIRDGTLSFSDPQCVVAPVAAFLTFALAVYAVRNWLRRPYVLSACGYALIMVLPTLGIVQHGMVQLAGDRYAYLPLAAATPLLAGFLASHLPGAAVMRPSRRWLALQWSAHRGGPGGGGSTASSNSQATTVAHAAVDTGQAPTPKPSRPDPQPEPEPLHAHAWGMLVSGGGAVLLAAVLLFTVVCQRQIAVWRNDHVLWHHSLRVDPTDWRINAIYAEFLVFSQRLEEAQPYLIEELKYMPSPHRGIQPCMERAKSLYLIGRADEACLLYEWTFQRWDGADGSGELLTNLGVCALRDGDVDRARSLMGRAHTLLPLNDAVRVNWESIQGFQLGRGSKFTGSIVW